MGHISSAGGESIYRYPPINLLDKSVDTCRCDVAEEIRLCSHRILAILTAFDITAKLSEIIHGPRVTRYEVILNSGVKLSKLVNLSQDIALALGVPDVQIAPVLGKYSTVCIEVPNRFVASVRIRDVIESREFIKHPSFVAVAIGKDGEGNNVVGDIDRLSPVFVAGTTGSGKSALINSFITSILFKATPDEVRFIMIDTKGVELTPYEGIPQLLIPVVTDPYKAVAVLQWSVYEIMKRYKVFSENAVNNLTDYNVMAEKTTGMLKLPLMLIIIDDLSDIMAVSAMDTEDLICRVAQAGKQAGIYLIISTQISSPRVITNRMKLAIRSCAAFAVSSVSESYLILGSAGAEKLVGKGDMLFFSLDDVKPTRVQGCFITPKEIDKVVEFIKDETEKAHCNQDVIEKTQQVNNVKAGKATTTTVPAGIENDGDLFSSAMELVLETGQASVSMLQRRLKLGYSRASRLVDEMEELGFVGPFEGSIPRQILITREEWQALYK